MWFSFRVATLMLCLSLCTLGVSAKEITFPENELASEAALPVFDESEAVKNRHVILKEKMEIGLLAGAALNEPFFGPFNFGGTFTYNYSEEMALHLGFNYWLDGDSTFKQQLEADELIVIEGAPQTEFMALANFQYAPFYGKMSLTKQSTSNFHLFVLGGGGVISIGGQLNPVISIGLGQKFYFSPNFSLRFDLLGLFYSGADPLSVEITDPEEPPATSEFEKRSYINTLLAVSLVFVL